VTAEEFHGTELPNLKKKTAMGKVGGEGRKKKGFTSQTEKYKDLDPTKREGVERVTMDRKKTGIRFEGDIGGEKILDSN